MIMKTWDDGLRKTLYAAAFLIPWVGVIIGLLGFFNPDNRQAGWFLWLWSFIGFTFSIIFWTIFLATRMNSGY